MRDWSELKERIKLSNPIEEIVRETVPLGPHNKALCPFHKEDTPSFLVNVKEQYFHCFGCGVGGDVFNFVMRQKGLSFPEALRYLAERKGIQVSLDNIAFQEEQKRRTINSALAEAAKIYHESLSAEVIDYLKGRGLTEETIKAYRIGFCNGQSKYSLPQEDLLSAGLIYEDGRNYFEGFITFPHMLYGRVVYISGRGYPEKKHKKLEKDRVPLTHLYNEQVLSQKEVILAEGEIDTLTLLQHGFNACGVLGAGSFKEEWVDKFKNCETVYLSFDADEAGEKGNLRIAEFLGSKAKLVFLPDGEDANDFFKHSTKEDYQKLLEQSLLLIEYKIKTIPKTILPTRLPDALNPILKELAQLNLAQADVILRHFIKAHFNLTLDDIETYAKVLKSYRKESEEMACKPPEKEDLLKILNEQKDDIPLVHPAQGYGKGVMHFAVRVGERLCIVTSDKRLFSFESASQHGIRLKEEHVDITNFSVRGIKAFLNTAVKINLPELYDKIAKHIGKFIIFPDDAYLNYLALWVMGTYVFTIFSNYPYVWLNALKDSGKTSLMKILAPIAFNGDLITSPTAPVLFRDISNNLVCLFIDEVERFTKKDKDKNSDVFDVLNQGYGKSGTVKRLEKPAEGKFKVATFSPYAPKMFASIKDIEDTLKDRTVPIRILRKKDTEKAKRYKGTPTIQEIEREIRDELYMFALLYAADIFEIYNAEDEEAIAGMEHLSNRELDIWEPIFLLANIIDCERGTKELTLKMKALSKEVGKDKKEDSRSEDEMCKILSVLKPMFEDVLPFSKDDGIYLYEVDKVLEYFKRDEEFAWLENSSSLTRRLKRIRVRSEQKWTGTSERKRFYKFIKSDIDDLCERQGI